MNLPPDKARLLRQYDNEKKWDLICDQVRGEGRGWETGIASWAGRGQRTVAHEEVRSGLSLSPCSGPAPGGLLTETGAGRLSSPLTPPKSCLDFFPMDSSLKEVCIGLGCRVSCGGVW